MGLLKCVFMAVVRESTGRTEGQTVVKTEKL